MDSSDLRQLIDRLGEASAPQQRREIAEQLREGGAEGVPVLMEALGHDSRFVRMTVARALGDLGALQAVPRLVELMGDRSVQVQRAAEGRATRVVHEDVDAAVEPVCGHADQTVDVIQLRDITRHGQHLRPRAAADGLGGSFQDVLAPGPDGELGPFLSQGDSGRVTQPLARPGDDRHPISNAKVHGMRS